MRYFRVGKHCFKADAEPANLVLLTIVLTALANTGYAQNVILGECATIVLESEAI